MRKTVKKNTDLSFHPSSLVPHPSVRQRRTAWAVVTDFDGTVTLRDVGDVLLLHFKAATREEIERAYSPSVNIKEWMKRFFRPLDVTKRELEAYVRESTRLRGGFPELARFCAGRRFPLEIVSGGLDLYIDCLLKKWGLKVKTFCGRARFTPRGLAIDYPRMDGASLDDFKTARVRHYRRLGCRVAFCGDATTDIKAAQAADAVFAAKRLWTHCRQNRLPARRLKNFRTVLDLLSRP